MIDKLKTCHDRYRFCSKLPQNAIVLDLGCGSGDMQRKLLKFRGDLKFISVDKYDFSCNFADNFYKVDIEKESIPIKQNSIDAVFCSHVFEHMQNLEVVLRELKRVLKADAFVYIEVPSVRSIFLPSLRFIKRHNAPINFYDDPTHLKPFTKQGLCTIGLQLGLKKIKVKTARNWSYIVLFPLILLIAIAKKDAQLFVNLIWNLSGWCVCLLGENVEK